jgi:hypothetical protein
MEVKCRCGIVNLHQRGAVRAVTPATNARSSGVGRPAQTTLPHHENHSSFYLAEGSYLGPPLLLRPSRFYPIVRDFLN